VFPLTHGCATYQRARDALLAFTPGDRLARSRPARHFGDQHLGEHVEPRRIGELGEVAEAGWSNAPPHSFIAMGLR
jgi:hypothetical protein